MPRNKMVREPEQKKPYSVLRAKLSESAANTWTESNIQTPVSASYFQAMRIHKVAFDLDLPNVVEDTTTTIGASLHTQTRSSIATVSDPGHIANTKMERRWMSSAAGGESEIIKGDSGSPAQWEFGEQGLLVTDAQIHLGVKGSGNVSVKTVHVSVYYTLETLEPDEYIAALTTLGADL